MEWGIVAAEKWRKLYLNNNFFKRKKKEIISNKSVLAIQAALTKKHRLGGL